MTYIYLLVCMLSLSFSSLLGVDKTRCQICDPAKHSQNQKLLSSIIERELAQCPIDKKAEFLSCRIREITKKLIAEGFAPEAYGIPEFDQNSYLSFAGFPLWEGKEHSIPLSLVIIVWPPEELAKRYKPNDSLNQFYASCIHSHPISCALAVLNGEMTQQNYVLSPSFPKCERVVELVNEEIFRFGEGAVDSNEDDFIHRLVCRQKGEKPCLTLHAYGACTMEECNRIFNEASAECEYTRVFKKTPSASGSERAVLE